MRTAHGKGSFVNATEDTIHFLEISSIFDLPRTRRSLDCAPHATSRRKSKNTEGRRQALQSHWHREGTTPSSRKTPLASMQEPQAQTRSR
jgi:hypothetical protein